MTRQLVIEAQATNQAAAFLADDAPGLSNLLDEIDKLPDDPRSATSFPFGSPDLRRLRIGRYRVLYEVTDDQILVGRIARVAAGSG